MSHPVNDELLETLYEEELDYFTNHPKVQSTSGVVMMTQQDIETAAEIMARKRFENLCY